MTAISRGKIVAKLPPDQRVWNWMYNGFEGCLDIMIDWTVSGNLAPFWIVGKIKLTIQRLETLRNEILERYGKCPNKPQS